MEDATTPTCAIELIVLRALPTAVRCRELDGSAVTYRKSLAHVVPGLRLTVRPERRWKFRRTAMIGGPLQHAGFSLRALSRAGFATPRTEADGLACPGARDPRLREALV